MIQEGTDIIIFAFLNQPTTDCRLGNLLFFKRIRSPMLLAC